MLQRCENPKSPDYQLYGARGIAVCAKWHDFTTFYADMGDPPAPHYQLDRIDNNGPYAPENCRWSSPKAQANNRRSNTLLIHLGRAQTLAQWAEELGIPQATLSARLRVLHWPVEKALTCPVRTLHRHHPN
jgi:hypothetical protein